MVPELRTDVREVGAGNNDIWPAVVLKDCPEILHDGGDLSIVYAFFAFYVFLHGAGEDGEHLEIIVHHELYQGELKLNGMLVPVRPLIDISFQNVIFADQAAQPLGVGDNIKGC